MAGRAPSLRAAKEAVRAVCEYEGKDFRRPLMGILRPFDPVLVSMSSVSRLSS